MTTPQISMSLCSSFELRHDHRRLDVPVPAQRLLAFLALQGRSVQRRVAAGTLWHDLDERAAAARLRSTLWRLPVVGGVRLVETPAGQVELSPVVEVDVRVAEDDNRVAELEVTRLSGDVLTGWDEPWIDVERERFHQLRLRRIEQLSDLARERGDLSTALHAALTAAAAEPLRESSHRRVMLVHLADDNPAEALRQYDLIRGLLREQLGIGPAGATRAVVAAFLGRPLDRAS